MSYVKNGLLSFVVFCWIGTVSAQHGHLNAGAHGTNQNDQLYWVNGARFATESGFVRTMIYTNAGRFADTFNHNITLTALPQTIENGGPVPSAPALGSLIVAEIVSVTGPDGGTFTFWETNSTSANLQSIPVGTTNANVRYWISDPAKGAGSTPTSDPFGHLHGRRFSVNKTGQYTVGFRAVDVSTNGAGGGPIHTPSDVLLINFEGVLSVGSIVRTNGQQHLSFKAEEPYHYRIEYADEVSSANTVWQPTNISLAHTNGYVTVVLPEPSNQQRYYRIRRTSDSH